jgi:hypothetical protein
MESWATLINWIIHGRLVQERKLRQSWTWRNGMWAFAGKNSSREHVGKKSGAPSHWPMAALFLTVSAGMCKLMTRTA